MAGEVPRTLNALNEGPKHVGRTLAIGGALVAGGLFSFMYSMARSKRLEQAQGRNPMHEQITGHATQKIIPSMDDLHEIRGVKGTMSGRPPIVTKHEHHSGHMTISAYNQAKKEREASEDLDAEAGTSRAEHQNQRTMAPPPQRGRKQDGRAYTKSPDYAKNYEKTEEGKMRTPLQMGIGSQQAGWSG